jgi:phage gpG-like protein
MKFTVEGQDKLINDLNSLLKGVKDRQLMKELSGIVLQDVKTRVGVSKLTPEGTPWVPWSPATLRYRQKKNNVNQGLLFDTGKLLNSFKATSGIQTFSVGTDVTYAPFLNNGTNRMPARKFMGISEQAYKSMEAIINSKIGLPKK